MTNKTKKTRASKGNDPELLYSYIHGRTSEARVEALIDSLEEWSYNLKKVTSIGDFLRKEKISSSHYCALRKKYPKLQEAHDEAKAAIGEQLYKDAVYNRANWAAVHFRIHHYSQEFADAKKFNADIQKTDSTPPNIEVIINEIG